MGQRLLAILLIFQLLGVGFALGALEKKESGLAQQLGFEGEGKKLENLERFDEAVNKYHQALNPKLIEREGNKSTAKGALVNLYLIQGKYELALSELEWFNEWQKNHGFYKVKKPGIEAQIVYNKTGDKSLIYKHIDWLKKEYQKDLPPFGFDDFYFSTIIRLYDFIQDYDVGITFIDNALVYLRSNAIEHKDAYKSFDTVKTSIEADRCSELDVFPVPKRNPEWRACKLIREFLLLREGLEKDKQNGGPDCTGQKYCIGSATRALIRSDYFSW